MKTRLQEDFARSGSAWAHIDLLLVVALATDLLTPILIWKGILPAPTRWVSHAAVAAMMFIAYARMMAFDHVPGIMLLIGGISAIGVGVALFEGQAIVPTLWGWWLMFQFPLVGLYAYLQPQWPDRFPQRLRLICMAILGSQVLVQFGQYLTGEPPGDSLAGTFGEHGAAKIVIFILLVLCLTLGRWLARGGWKSLFIVLALGGLSSVLAEIKLFPFAVVALGMASILLFVLQGRERWKLAPYAVLMGTALLIFFRSYDAVILSTRSARPLQSYLELRTLDDYLGGVRQGAGGERYFLGRNYALRYGWNTIQRDARTFLFGMGLGARGESKTLGTAGVGLAESDLGLTTGTSLLVMMQELGLFGMATLGGFNLWILVRLLKDIRSNTQSDATELRYALLLFSLLWPLWLWYQTAWVFRVSMLVYWAALGYVLGEADRKYWGPKKSGVEKLSIQYGKGVPV